MLYVCYVLFGYNVIDMKLYPEFGHGWFAFWFLGASLSRFQEDLEVDNAGGNLASLLWAFTEARSGASDGGAQSVLGDLFVFFEGYYFFEVSLKEPTGAAPF